MMQIEINPHLYRPQQQIWAAVIDQALQDAVSTVACMRKEREEARKWFRDAGNDFREVCSLAGQDHEWIRRNALAKIDAAVNDPKPNRNKEKTIVYKGEPISLPELSRRTGVSVSTLRSRLNTGVPVDEIAVSQRVSGRRKRVSLLTYNGEEHTIKEWAAIRGMSFQTLASRLKLGWSVERTLTTAIIPASERCGRGRKRSVDASKAA